MQLVKPAQQERQVQLARQDQRELQVPLEPLVKHAPRVQRVPLDQQVPLVPLVPQDPLDQQVRQVLLVLRAQQEPMEQ